jgi:hypothetical protein
MTLAEGDHSLLAVRGETIVWPLWAARMIFQGFTHRCERTRTELIEITATDPVLCCHCLHHLASEQGQDGLQTMLTLRTDRRLLWS